MKQQTSVKKVMALLKFEALTTNEISIRLGIKQKTVQAIIYKEMEQLYIESWVRAGSLYAKRWKVRSSTEVDAPNPNAKMRAIAHKKRETAEERIAAIDKKLAEEEAKKAALEVAAQERELSRSEKMSLAMLRASETKEKKFLMGKVVIRKASECEPIYKRDELAVALFGVAA